MRFRRHPLALVIVALPWLLATVGVSLHACPDHGDTAHATGHSNHVPTSHSHTAAASMAGHGTDTPADSPLPHQCNCPGAACCTAAVAIASGVIIDAPVTVDARPVSASRPTLTRTSSGHDIRLPFANGPPHLA